MPEETAVPSSSECMDEKPCSSTAAVGDGSVDVFEEAKKLIGTGKRHLVMGDAVSAVSVFQDACGMLAEKYGDTADECGEAFFLCGKALLDLARVENTVLGNALEGVPEESSEEGEKQNDSKIESADNLDEETRDELRTQVYEAMAEKEGTSDSVQKDEGKVDKEADDVTDAQNAESEPKNEKDPESEENEKLKDQSLADQATQDQSECKMASNQEGESDNAKDKTEAAEEKDSLAGDGVSEKESQDEGPTPLINLFSMNAQEEEEEVGNLQLAWEMLEVAKVIYKRKESQEDQLMTAQIFLKLGEVGAESGNYAQALEDFQECLVLQLKHLPPHSRLLAETHYQLGTTFSYMGQYKQSIEHFSSSIKVIESRLAMLEEVISKAEGAEAAKEEKSELEELKQLLPDIKEKVEDAKESQRTAAAASEAIQGKWRRVIFHSRSGNPLCFQISDKPADCASSSKPPSDISHLVRKKRKPEEESPKKDSEAKKAKQEATLNGNGDSASNGNGVQEKMQQEASC
uniref:Tetratricopeptide SHNi-TPR domain-containing protein n=1 Tax=Denticeps clupeoides TaxID=299321 RepID=A0AAY4BTI5_9TELE